MNFFDQNRFIVGWIIGILSPLLGSAIVYFIFEFMVASGWMDEAVGGWRHKRMRTIIILGISTNIFWIKRANHPFRTQQLRGLTTATMLLSFVWFFAYYPTLYED